MDGVSIRTSKRASPSGPCRTGFPDSRSSRKPGSTDRASSERQLEMLLLPSHRVASLGRTPASDSASSAERLGRHVLKRCGLGAWQ